MKGTCVPKTCYTSLRVGKAGLELALAESEGLVEARCLNSFVLVLQNIW